MPLETISNPSAPSSKQPLLSAVARAWMVVAGLATLGSVWTLLQLLQTVRPVGVQALLLPALIIYAGGMGYLALTQFIALRYNRAIRSGRVPEHSLLLWAAHVLVLVSALSVAWRGGSARGALVGIGASLVAWGVVAILALVAEIATGLVRKQFTTNESAVTNMPRIGSMASACLGCGAVLGLSLAYLESRPLPNSPDKPHVPTGLEAGSDVTPEKSATRDEPSVRGDS